MGGKGCDQAVQQSKQNLGPNSHLLCNLDMCFVFMCFVLLVSESLDVESWLLDVVVATHMDVVILFVFVVLIAPVYELLLFLLRQ